MPREVDPEAIDEYLTSNCAAPAENEFLAGIS